MPLPNSDLQISRASASLRVMVEERLRQAIRTGSLKPGQRLVERELCESTGVSRASIREALRQLEAEGLVTTAPHKGPTVSTISSEEAEQLYDLRALLEGHAGRICARKRDPEIIKRLRKQYDRMVAVSGKTDRTDLLAAKTEFYAALLDGCGNVFVQRFLNQLLNRVTLLRMTSMTQKDRIGRSLKEIAAILKAIEAGDEDAAERACVKHIRNAAEVALAVFRNDTPLSVKRAARKRA